MLSEDILYSSITELGAHLRAKRFSPVELTESYLERLEKFGPVLHAVAEVMRDSALKEAREAEREIVRGRFRGPLHGIPYGVKDLLATRNAKTTWGAQPFRNQQFDYDATVVRRLREAGAILIAKLAMIELAGGLGYNQPDASWTGPCSTPWNLNFWSGGSSSGPSAATSAALVSFSIGSETSGSIITPSAFGGVTGLRPTYGAVSRHGAMALCWTLDKLGPMCRSARDCRIVFDAIAGRDPLDPTSRDFPKGARPLSNRRQSRKQWVWPDGANVQPILGSGFAPALKSTKGAKYRVAVMKDSYEKAQAEVRANFLRSVDVLKSLPGVEVVMDVKLPDFPYGPAVGTIVDAEGASAFRDLIESGRAQELTAPRDRTGGYSGLLVTAVDYLHAMRLRAPMRRAWKDFFTKYSFIAAPSRATVAYPIDKTFEQVYPGISAQSPIAAGNLVGIPAISVPNGFGENNLPTGLQLVGPAWSEHLLTELADNYQQSTDWHRRRPPINNAEVRSAE